MHIMCILCIRDVNCKICQFSAASSSPSDKQDFKGYSIYYSLWTEPWKPGLKFNLCITSGDILYITIYELSPGNQVSSSIYALLQGIFYILQFMNWALETRSQVQSMHYFRAYSIYYSLWTEPWKPGLKFNPCICKDNSYSCLMILSESFQGLCMCSNICTLKQILMAENMLAAWYVHYVNCKTCRTLPSSAQRTTHVADKQDSGDILYYITMTEPWKPGLKFKKVQW